MCRVAAAVKRGLADVDAERVGGARRKMRRRERAHVFARWRQCARGRRLTHGSGERAHVGFHQHLARQTRRRVVEVSRFLAVPHAILARRVQAAPRQRHRR